jgi:ELWxxDGT repeat protein
MQATGVRQFAERFAGQFVGAGLLALALALALTGCSGSGGDEAPAAPGTATIGQAGGRVSLADGAEVVFSPKALDGDVAVAITIDSTGAPPLPPDTQPAGAVYTITPHGGDFKVHAEVSIPVDRAALADNEQLLLVTAQPGETQWTVLSGAVFVNGKLRAPVMHFSYFRAIVLVDRVVPTLTTTINDGELFRPVRLPRTNNVGGPGIGVISPDYEFTSANAQFDWTNIVLDARLTYPPAPPSRATVGGVAGAIGPQTCRPLSLGHDGAQWRVLRDGTPVSLADVRRAVLFERTDPAEYPGQPGPNFRDRPGPFGSGGSLLDRRRDAPGFAALHFYGDSAVPPRGPYLPAGSTDVWASPPAGNVIDDDTYMWHGRMLFKPLQHNGRIRIETSVATDCNLAVQAVPIGFRLNLVGEWANGPYGGVVQAGYRGVEAQADVVAVGSGETAVLPFMEIVADSSQSIRWEFSTDAVNWQATAVPAERIQRGADEPGSVGSAFSVYNQRPYAVVIPNAQLRDAGYYRAWACAKPAGTYCLSAPPLRLAVHTEPPLVVQQPTAQTVTAGERATFTARGGPSGPVGWSSTGSVVYPTVQWQRRHVVEAAFNIGDWANIPGASGPEGTPYTTAPTTEADNGYLVRALFTSAAGTTATQAVLLTVLLPQQPSPPIVTGQPAHQDVVAGSTATFVATVTGTAPFNYQWRRNGTNLPGANSATLTLSNVTAQDDGLYDLVVTNRVTSVTSSTARLTVAPTPGQPLPPQILAAPASISVAEGQAANFAVAVSGTGPFTYQWLKNGVAVAGGTAAAFTLSPVTANDIGSYSVRVGNAAGTATSTAATLAVMAAPGAVATPPVIAMAPISLAVPPGAGATLAVAVTGTAPFSYRWLRNGETVAGATGPMLNIAAAAGADAGAYTVVVTNAAGTATSAAAHLIVIGAPTLSAQPLNTTAFVGASATFSVTASGDALRYLWLRDGLPIGGAVAASYTTPPLTLADQGAVYSVIVYNGAGVAVSTRAVLTVMQAAAFPANAVPLRATHAVHGQELWMTDGTPGGTVLLKDINPGSAGSSPSFFTRLGGHVYLAADDGSSGTELWRSDGTEAGTVRVLDLNPGAAASWPRNLVACNGRLFFGATNGSAEGVYASDGTAAGTVRLANAILGNYNPVACWNNVVYFHGAAAGSGSELWRSDGTVAGTYLLADIVPGTDSSNPEEFVPFQGHLYFQAANQLWRTDGTTAGTVRVSDAAFTPRRFVVNGSTLYFTAQTGAAGFEPWKSDGTAAGTVMIADLVPGSASSYPYAFVVANGVTLFAANPASNAPATLWRTDGSAAGTLNLTPGLRYVAAYGDSILEVNGTLFFSAAASGTNVELYKSDGTAGGTGLVAELMAGTSGSYPSGFFRLGDLLYFSATADFDTELWRSDGTSAGTVLVQDLCTAANCGGNPQPR